LVVVERDKVKEKLFFCTNLIPEMMSGGKQ
jgi:hypothetical protein